MLFYFQKMRDLFWYNFSLYFQKVNFFVFQITCTVITIQAYTSLQAEFQKSSTAYMELGVSTMPGISSRKIYL